MQTTYGHFDNTWYPKWLQRVTGVTHNLETFVFLVKQQELRNSIFSIQVGLDTWFGTRIVS